MAQYIEYIILGVLLLAALFIVIAVTAMKSSDDGLSGTIVGGTETYYGKDKSVHKNKKLGKWVLVISIIFGLAVLAVYVMQPDYHASNFPLDSWKDASNYSSIFE